MLVIPDMSKPKTCEDCPCAYFTEGAYTDECQVTHNHITDEKPTDCPLIEIDDTAWENEKYKLIRMTQAVRINKAMAERRADERINE